MRQPLTFDTPETLLRSIASGDVRQSQRKQKLRDRKCTFAKGNKAMIRTLRLTYSTFACVTALASIAPGCKARSLNSNSPSSRAKSDASAAEGSTALPVGVDPKLLTDLAPPVDNPVSNPLQDAIVSFPSPDIDGYTMLLDDTGKPRGQVDAEFSWTRSPLVVPKYETILKKAQEKDATIIAPAPFAGAAVLRIMRQNRRAFMLIAEGGNPNTPTLLGIEEAKSILSQPIDKIDQQWLLKDPSRPFSGSPCGGWDQRDYSDVRWHYYCAVPGIFRACQRKLVDALYERDLPAFLNKYRAGTLDKPAYFAALVQLKKKSREDAHSYCLDPSTPADATLREDFSSRLAQVEDRYKLTPGTILRLFQVFHTSQKDPVTGVNMYDYIMRSGLYAFDFAQQQAVLNTYYGDLKPTSEGPFDPSNATECAKYRDWRENSENTAPGAASHCLADTPRLIPFFDWKQ